MKRVLLKSLSLLAVFFQSLPFMAQSYEAQWKEVERLQKDALPASVIRAVDKIYVRAEREGNFSQMLKAYLYCCYRYLPQEQYVKMLSNEPVYLSIGSVLKEEIRKAAENVKVDATDEQLGRWKKEYQRGNI